MGHALGHYLQLRRLAARVRMAPEALAALRVERLRLLLRHAYDHAPYYRELMDSTGMRPEDVGAPGDLERLPVTPIGELRALPEDAVGPPLKQPYEIRETSGSMSGRGSPVVIGADEALERALVTVRGEIENGYRIWRRQAFVEPPPFRASTWFKRLGVLESLYVSRFDDLEVQLRRLQRFRPYRLSGQPSGLRRLAEHAREFGCGALRPKLIHTLGERLKGSTRGLLEEVFDAPVFDRYGATEVGIIGWECERQDGYHLNVDQLGVECVDGGGRVEAGLPGEVVVTNLASFLRPLIRVGLGDVAIMAPARCGCGRSFPRLAAVLGRTREFIEHPGDGRWIEPSEVERMIGGVPELKDFRLAQSSCESFTLQLVADSEETLEMAGARARQLLGGDARHSIERRGEIPPGPSGKPVRVIRLEGASNTASSPGDLR